MAAAGQGINKITVFKKQTAFDTPASGSGGQILRRRTSVFQAPRDTFESDEIVSHHQSTGLTYGLKHASGRIEGLLSPGTFAPFFGTILERVFTAGIATTGASITIAGTGPTWTVTRAAGSFLTDGFKIGDVVRLSVGTFNANNLARNLWVVGVTALVLTVRTLDGGNLTAEGPIATSTVTQFGKKTWAPITGHVDEYYTFEEWYADKSRSELYPDMKPSQISLGLPPNANSTFAMDLVGRKRTRSGVQVLTSPAVESSADIFSSIHGGIVVNGALIDNITAMTINLANGAEDQGPVVGSVVSPGIQKGRIRVSGSFSAMFDQDTIQAIYDAETTVGLQAAVTTSYLAAADFIAFALSKIKITGDTPDDGEKAIIRTYPFTAEVNMAGGAGTTSEQSIMSVQDSLA